MSTQFNTVCFLSVFKSGKTYYADIDLDIPDNRRDEVLAYVYRRYGANHVARLPHLERWRLKWSYEMLHVCLA